MYYNLLRFTKENSFDFLFLCLDIACAGECEVDPRAHLPLGITKTFPYSSSACIILAALQLTNATFTTVCTPRALSPANSSANAFAHTTPSSVDFPTMSRSTMKYTSGRPANTAPRSPNHSDTVVALWNLAALSATDRSSSSVWLIRRTCRTSCLRTSVAEKLVSVAESVCRGRRAQTTGTSAAETISIASAVKSRAI